jgi:hypothetical protein
MFIGLVNINVYYRVITFGFREFVYKGDEKGPPWLANPEVSFGSGYFSADRPTVSVNPALLFSVRILIARPPAWRPGES